MRAETARLLLRPFKEDDAEALHLILSDPEVMRWIEPPFSIERTRSFLREAGLCRPPLIHAVVEKQSGVLIGQLIWHPWDEKAMELGWILRRDQWGKGFARELTEAMLAGSGTDVLIECSPEQSVTKHIAVRCGFRPEARRDGLDVWRYRKETAR